MKNGIWALLLVVALVSLLFAVSCQGDDDDNDDDNPGAGDPDDDDNDHNDDNNNDDNNNDDDNNDDAVGDDDDDVPGIQGISHSDCKDGSMPPDKKEETWDEDIAFSYEDSVLTVTHVNVEFNCCMDHVDVTMEIQDFEITLYEVEVTPDPCWCICPFDVETEIANLPPGTYTVDIYANGEYAIGGETTIPE